MDEIATAFEALVAELRGTNGAVHALIHPDAAQPVKATAAPAPAVAPAPKPAPVAAVTGWPWIAQVLVTCFGNEEDEKSGEWSQTAYGWFPCSPGSGKTEAFCAVPFKAAHGDSVLVRRTDGRVVRVPVGDQGPWNDATHPDPYLPNGTRPEAESGTDLRGRKTNLAGLDLTPAAWALITDKTPEQEWAGSPSGRFDVQWSPVGSQAPASALASGMTRASVLDRARSLINAALTYALGKQPPGDESDCSGFVDWCNGINRNNSGENTDAMVSDAESAHPHYYERVNGPAKPADAYVFPSGNGHSYGHTGVISEVDGNGVPVKVIHCTSANPPGRAVQETAPDVFTKNGAIIVRAVALID